MLLVAPLIARLAARRGGTDGDPDAGTPPSVV
jgi:hypothetical protein